MTQAWVWVGGALATIVTAFVTRITYKKGQTMPATPTVAETISMPGALVDGSSVRQLAAAVNGLISEDSKLVKIGGDLVKSLDSLTGHLAKANVLTEKEEEDRERRERDKLREETEALKRSLADAQRQIDARRNP